MFRKTIIILALSAISAAAAAQNADSLAFVNASWEVTALPKGGEIRYASIPMFGSVQSVSVAVYPAKKFRTGIVEGEGMSMGETKVKKGHANHAMHTSVLAKAGKGKVAINGNYFNTKHFFPVCYTRIGKNVYGRTSSREASSRTNGAITISRNGHKVDIFTADTLKTDSVPEWYSVMAAGPVLVEDGVARYYTPDEVGTNGGFFNRRHPRSLVGYTVDAKGKTDKIYMVVIDGRFPGQGDGATIEECTKICTYLGLYEALNLDGGGSSTLWSKETGVVNYPYDNRTWDHEGERRVPNILIAR